MSHSIQYYKYHVQCKMVMGKLRWHQVEGNCIATCCFCGSLWNLQRLVIVNNSTCIFHNAFYPKMIHGKLNIVNMFCIENDKYKINKVHALPLTFQQFV